MWNFSYQFKILNTTTVSVLFLECRIFLSEKELIFNQIIFTQQLFHFKMDYKDTVIYWKCLNKRYVLNSVKKINISSLVIIVPGISTLIIKLSVQSPFQ